MSERASKPWIDEPSVSWLSQGRFRDCERKWFNSYCKDLLPDPPKFEFIKQYKLMPWSAFAGRVVDDTITEGIRRWIKKGSWPASFSKAAEHYMNRYLDLSERWIAAVRGRKKWPTELQPLDRYYFDERPSQDELDALLTKAQKCLVRFEESSMPDLIQRIGPAGVVSPTEDSEVAPSFDLDGIRVYAKYDLILRTPEKLTVIDWKTGRLSDDSTHEVTEQLHWYAAYVIDKWAVAMDEIALVPVWLGASNEWREQRVQPELLDEIREKWRKFVAEMRRRHMEAGPSVAKLAEAYPLTANLRLCERCPFRACEGYKRVARR